METQDSHSVPCVIIRKEYVLLDSEITDSENKLGKQSNNGRKILATEVKEQFGEQQIAHPVWKVPYVFPTGHGGIEVATFTEYASQDRHKHLKGTEIYTVLKGTLEIYINDEGPYILNELDEVVIFPGTIHEVVQQCRESRKNYQNFGSLIRVHSINCFGEDDKYVQLSQDSEWKLWKALSKEERRGAYKMQS